MTPRLNILVVAAENDALQRIRPLKDHESSLDAWYPGIGVDSAIIDQRWPDCINLMRAGINLVDKVHAISPTYTHEILQPSDVNERGYFGGEGLEADLQFAAHQERLVGILNGCEYPQEEVTTEGLEHSQLATLSSKELWRRFMGNATLPIGTISMQGSLRQQYPPRHYAEHAEYE